MRTRRDELVEPFARLAAAFGVGDRALVETLADRCGWGARPITAPLLPSGVRHGVPWGLSIAMTRRATELRVFLEAQHDPPSPAAYLAAAERLLDGHADLAPQHALGTPQRLWHAVAFARDLPPAFQAYACAPDHSQHAWQALARRGHAPVALRRALPARARPTMVSADLAKRGRTKLYVLVPEARPRDLPHVDTGADAFAHAMLGSDAPIGWLVSYGFTRGDKPSSVALHFGAQVHGDAGFPERLAAYLRARELDAYDRACAALGTVRHHFVAYTQGAEPRVTVYFLPDVAR